MKKFLLFMFGVLLAFQNIAAYDFTYEYEGMTLLYDYGWEEGACIWVGISDDSYENNEEINLISPSVVTDGESEFTVRVIGNGVFSGLSKLISVTIPESVTEIYNNAFKNCSKLASVTIPESVTEIYGSAFEGCSSLISVNIPESVTYIGEQAFRNCSSLTSVNIPESVTQIWDSAFEGCSSLTSVTIPKSVTIIQLGTFEGCSSLTLVNIPESVTEICDRAFYDCSSLTSLTIPKSVTKIGQRAFYNCDLKSLAFMPSDCMVGDTPFSRCSDLVFSSAFHLRKLATYDRALISSDSSNFFSSVNAKILFEDGDNATVDVEKGIIWYADGTECFLMTDYTGSLIMPDGMTYLYPECLSFCEKLTDVQLPGTLEEIGSYVFYSTGVTEVVIPNRVTIVDRDAFKYANLVKGAYPDAVESPFDESVVAIEYDAVDSMIKDNFVYSRRGDKLYYAPLSISAEFEIPASVTEITDKAFSKCEALSKIILPENLSALGNSVWEDCTNITSVVCNNPEPVETERDAFHVNVYKDATLFVPKGSKAKYESTMPWSYFYNITEVESGINGVMTDDADAIDYTLPVKVYNLQGVMVAESMENLPAGIYIVRQGKNVKKIAVK